MIDYLLSPVYLVEQTWACISSDKLPSKSVSLFQAKRPECAIVSCSTLVGRVLNEYEVKERLLKACDEGDIGYLEKHLDESFVGFVFDHFNWQFQDLFLKKEIRARFQKKSLEELFGVVFDKANKNQKMVMLRHLYYKNKWEFLSFIPISDEIAVSFVEFLLKIAGSSNRRIQANQALFNDFFKNHTNVLVTKFCENVLFGHIFLYLDDKVKMKVMRVLVAEGRRAVFKSFQKDGKVSTAAFFTLLSNWEKFEKFEGSGKLLDVFFRSVKLTHIYENLILKADNDLEKNCSVHVVVRAFSQPSLSSYIEKVIPFIKDDSGLVQMACEHGNIDFLTKKGKDIKWLKADCLIHSARFGHVEVVDWLLNNANLQFMSQKGAVTTLEVVHEGIIEAVGEDDAEMLFLLLEWVSKNHEKSLSLVLQNVLENAAINRKERSIAFHERRALCAVFIFCCSVGYQFPLPLLLKAKELAEIEAADPISGQIIQGWIEVLKSSKQSSLSH